MDFQRQDMDIFCEVRLIKIKIMNKIQLVFLGLLFFSCGAGEHYSVLIRNATIIDGTGDERFTGDIAINDDIIVKVAESIAGTADKVISGEGLITSPGFVNMLSWATVSLLHDGRGMSDIMQGVTLEVMGEGWSMGPINDKMKQDEQESQGDIKYEVAWNTLGEYLTHLEDKGVSPNVASFVGATTLRIHELGYENRAPTEDELERMKTLAAQAMEEGAMGIGSSLIYAPAFYAETEELIELCKVASQYDGTYVTHMRSEGNRLIEGIEEVLRIAREADIQAEIYHLKAAGQTNWPKMDQVIDMLDKARSEGVKIATNMYNYVAGATGLNASMPPWVQEGGYEKWVERLQNPQIRKRVIEEMKQDAQDWENLYYSTGSPENVMLVGFKNDELKKYTGWTLKAVAEEMGMSPEETAIELVIQDGSRVGTVYFLMSEENVKKQIQLPYMTFGSDAGAPAAEGVFLQSSTHPRAYGNFTRLIGKYVRDEEVISLENAIHKLTKMPCDRLKIENRGLLREGYFADIVMFDLEKMNDLATFEKPHQYAEGMVHVLINGQQVLANGEHTGETPGRFIKGPGYVE